MTTDLQVDVRIVANVTESSLLQIMVKFYIVFYSCCQYFRYSHPCAVRNVNFSCVYMTSPSLSTSERPLLNVGLVAGSIPHNVVYKVKVLSWGVGILVLSFA